MRSRGQLSRSSSGQSVLSRLRWVEGPFFGCVPADPSLKQCWIDQAPWHKPKTERAAVRYKGEGVPASVLRGGSRVPMVFGGQKGGRARAFSPFTFGRAKEATAPSLVTCGTSTK